MNKDASNEAKSMNGIIYKATCTANGKSYVGITTTSLKERKNRHLYDARSTPRTANVFHRAIILHGPSRFQWEQIDTFSSEIEGKDKEQKWIVALRSLVGDNGYNMILGYNKCEQHVTPTDLDKAVQKLLTSGFRFYDPQAPDNQYDLRYENGILSYRCPCDTDCSEDGYMWIEDGRFDKYGNQLETPDLDDD